MEMHSDAIEKATMLSGVINLSARSSEQTSADSSRVREIEVSDLVFPVEVEIPINQNLLNEVKASGEDFKIQCMYLDEDLN